MNLKNIIIIFFVFSFFILVGCNKEKDKDVIVSTGIAKNTESSKYIVKFKNIEKNKLFSASKVWAEDTKGNKIKADIPLNFHKPIINIYQRDFDKDGRDEILVATEPSGDGLFFDFSILTLDKKFVTKEVFHSSGSLTFCDYWLLAPDNTIIHLDSMRDYTNKGNVIYKSKYYSCIYTPEVKNGKLVFVPGRKKESKYELDNLDGIKNVFGISKDAIVISNVSVN